MAQSGSDTIVDCKRCGTPNRIEHVERVAEEFTLCCRRCGRRMIYRIADIRTAERS